MAKKQPRHISSYSESDAINAYQRGKRSSAREVDHGEVVDPVRKESCRLDLALFLKTYFPDIYSLPFADPHKAIIAKSQSAILEGGKIANALPRGFGKTTIAEGACLWAALYGHRSFIVFIGASRDLALASLNSISSDVENSDLLQEDFPEVCDYVRALEGITARCRGQRCAKNGEATNISWSPATALVFPTIPGSSSCGATIIARGIEGGLRGIKRKSADGRSLRPDLLVADDLQTDDSAKNPSQVQKREDILLGTILGLAKHDRAVAAIMPCTVIQKNDLADRMTDPKKYPDWRGERHPMVISWPTRHEDMWLGTYQLLRRDDQEDSGSKATEYYQQNRVEMDAGGSVSWAECFGQGEISSLQHAYNLLIDRGEKIFNAEYQNQPMEDRSSAESLQANAVAARLNQHKNGVIPHNCEKLSAFFDVMPGGKNSVPQIYWMVCGAGTDFSGAIISYGIIKGRERKSEAEVLECLDKAAESVVGREWLRDDGLGMRIGRALVDSGDETELIYQWVRRCRFQGEMYASKGEGAPRDLAQRKPGRRIGERWVLGNPPDGRRIRLMRFDTNYWKTFAAARLSLPVGVPGAFSLSGSDPKTHRIMADHLASEYPHKEQKGDVVVTQWKQRPNVANHWWDCFVGCMVALSEQGCALKIADSIGSTTRTTTRKKGWFKK